MPDEKRTDSDADGLSDAVERKLGTNIHDSDSDDDGLIDGFEVAVGHARVRDLSITDPQGSAQIVDDLVKSMEDSLGVTHNADSDGDGFADWVEEMRGGSDRKVEDVKPADVLNNPNPLEVFMERAVAQTGTPYRFGAEADLDDFSGAPAFDSSELVQWAAHQAGAELPDGSWNQYRSLHESGNDVSVEVALATKGALLFGFSSDPLASPDRPQRAYVAISLGNGKVLDVSERAGEVREMDPGNFFTHAATIPAFYPNGSQDTDGDGWHDIDEDLMGGDPTKGISTVWRDTANMDTDGDGISDAQDPEPTIPDGATNTAPPESPVPAEPHQAPGSTGEAPLEEREPASFIDTSAGEPEAESVAFDQPTFDQPSFEEPSVDEPSFDPWSDSAAVGEADEAVTDSDFNA